MPASEKKYRFLLIEAFHLAENHNTYYYNLVVQHRFAERCASIRNINFPLPRPPSSRFLVAG